MVVDDAIRSRSRSAMLERWTGRKENLEMGRRKKCGTLTGFLLYFCIRVCTTTSTEYPRIIFCIKTCLTHSEEKNCKRALALMIEEREKVETLKLAISQHKKATERVILWIFFLFCLILLVSQMYKYALVVVVECNWKSLLQVVHLQF